MTVNLRHGIYCINRYTKTKQLCHGRTEIQREKEKVKNQNVILQAVMNGIQEMKEGQEATPKETISVK